MDPLTETCEHGNEPRSCLSCRRRARTWQELAAEEVDDADYLLNEPLDPQVTFEEIEATLTKVNNMLFGVNNLLKDLCWKLEKRRR